MYSFRSPEAHNRINTSVFAATMLKIVYGIDISDTSDEVVRIVDEGIEGTAQAFLPGRFLVDHIPWLEHIPIWFPGACFQRQLAKWRAAQMLVKDVPFMRRRSIVGNSKLENVRPR